MIRRFLPILILFLLIALTVVCGKAIEEACDAADKPTVKDLLALPPSEMQTVLGGIYESSMWVAEAVAKDKSTIKSIETVTDLAETMKLIVDAASADKKMELLRLHPDLNQKEEQIKNLTDESQEEQSRSGLALFTKEEEATFDQLKSVYNNRFKFPFILAVRNASKHTILAALEGRVKHTPEVEFAEAISQVHKIAWMRLLAKLDLSDAKGFLTCHVLDTANGIPARKMRIELRRLSPPESAGLVGQYFTNDDGRLENGPALKGGTELIVGEYEWTFYVADYFASMGTFTSGQPFLDTIPVRFGIDNPDDHYHVPLLASPWSFSTYRGS